LSDRYFLFVPMAVEGMARSLGPRVRGERLHNYMTGLGRAFLSRYPDVPVMRCRVKPGEAYIAPTENIVHDGSSEGQGASCHITLRGGCIFPGSEVAGSVIRGGTGCA
jgi:hypothetical protein